VATPDVVVAWGRTTELLEYVDNLEFVMAQSKGLLGDAVGADSMVHRD
jgi:hypothetical protein